MYRAYGLGDSERMACVGVLVHRTGLDIYYGTLLLLYTKLYSYNL